MRAFVKGCFDNLTGYGNTSTQLVVEMIKHEDIDIFPVVEGLGFEMPKEFTDLFMKKNPIGQHFDFYINVNVPNRLSVPDNFKFCDYKIGYTMWEQTKLTKNFSKKNFKDFDFLFVPCEMNQKCFEEFFDKKIFICPLGVETIYFSSIERSFENENLNICVNGAMTFRKGVDILIDVLLDKRIMNSGIKFNIKNSQMTMHPAISETNKNVHIYEGYWSKEQIRDFYYNNDIMLAISRGEGYNQPAVEFLSTGGVIITHNWGGHATWASSEWCKLLNYNLVPVKNWDGTRNGSLWAEVNKEEIIESLLYYNKNRFELKKLSFNAMKFGWTFSFEEMTKNFIKSLKEIKNELY